MAGNFMLLSSHSVLLMQQILGIKSTSDWIPLSVGYAGDGSPSLEDIMKAKKDKAAGDELSMYYGGGQGDQDAAAAVDTASEDSGQPTTTEGDLEEMEAVDTASEDAGQPTTSEGQPEGYGYDGPALNTSRRLDGQISKIVDDAFAKVTKDAPPIDAPVVIDAPQASAAGVQAPAAAAGGQAPAAAGQLPAMGGMMPAMGAGGAAVGAAGSATMPGMAGGMMPGMGGMPGMPGMGVGGDPFGGTSGVAALAMQGSAVLMELGVSIQQVVKLSHDILKICVKDDVKSAFKLASDHMHNLSYMGGHIMANGADILNQLADGVIAFQGHQYTEFGNHVGEAMRKIALSNNTNRTLPEGQAGQLVLSNLSAGLIDGFFGEGFLLDVSMPRGSAMHVDLHECMANNLVFFQSLWSDAMFWFAKKSQEHKDVLREANVSEGDETADEVLEGQHHKEKAEFGTAMALTMMQMPSALRRCNISKEQEEAFVDAMKTFGDGLNMRLTMPGEAGIKSQAADNLAQAVKDWTDMKWYSFGNDLGKVFQEMVTVMFPSKYSVDAAGGLRRMLQVFTFGSAGELLAALGSQELLWRLSGQLRAGHLGRVAGTVAFWKTALLRALGA
ncbi:unnamed protein product [Prorocentrum cordatum]|uniref:Uncharacterized protein n=1 Tax=Prorocentrum cordatum TaxID=2364126 RepID=A0ABN9S8T9_9DINO|nr:unnamed protein product [Polarella glacialis]